jgi:transglutaminase-like putative cysteine protease
MKCSWQRFSVIFLSAMTTVCAIAAPINPNNPPQGRFSDEWAEIYMAGAKVGYAHTTMNRDGEIITTGSTFHMVLGRAEQPVKIGMVQHSTETLAGVPVTFGSEMDVSVMKSATKGTVKDGKVTIVTSQYGMDQTQTFDFPTGALMSWGTFRESLLRGFKPGTKYTLQTYAPDLRLDGSVSAVTTIGDWEELRLRDEVTRGQKVTVTIESPVGSFEMVSWIDSDGEPLKAKVPIPGMGDIEIVTTDQATALRDFVPPEFFNTSTIPAKRKIDRAAARRIKYRLTAKAAGVELGDFPTTEMQTVAAKTDKSVELVVSRVSHKPRSESTPSPSQGEGRGEGQNDPSMAEYLDGNLMMNTADPKLIELAKQAAGGEKEPFALADRLRRFVTEYVETKSLNIGFATASEVARTKEGDCSEHGVLLAALGRLNGLPSRVAVGLAYVPVFGKQEDIFGYHLWTQFFIDGRWIDVDAALRETDCSPARIAFAVSSLKNAGLADLSLPLITKLGGIDLDILEIETGPSPSD